MLDTRVIMVCAECRSSWVPHVEPAKCTRADHTHQRRELHVHRELLILPDGTGIVATSYDPIDPYARDLPPDFGLYLDRRWRPPWPHDHLDWPDFGVPGDRSAAMAGLQALLDRAHSGDRVEVGCVGGHGRTGTAVAVLAVLAGHDPAKAIA